MSKSGLLGSVREWRRFVGSVESGYRFPSRVGGRDGLLSCIFHYLFGIHVTRGVLKDLSFTFLH